MAFRLEMTAERLPTDPFIILVAMACTDDTAHLLGVVVDLNICEVQQLIDESLSAEQDLPGKCASRTLKS